MITLKFISDLHINTKTDDNDFYLNETKFIKYINKVCIECDFLIVLGDMFEAWETLEFDAHVEKMKLIIEDRIGLIAIINKWINEGKLIYVNGNHDAVCRTHNVFPYVKREFFYEAENTKIYAEHGHRADIFCSGKLSIIGQFLTWIRGWLERLGFTDIDNDISILKNAVAKPFEDSIYLNWAKKLYKRYKADVILFGHTHDVRYTSGNNFTYVNTGKCCSRVNQFDEVTIELKHGTHKISFDVVNL